MKLLASSRDEPAIRYEMEKYGYTDVAFAEHRLMIKLEWIQLKYTAKEFNLRIVFGARVVCTCGALVCVGFIALVFIV